jgi:hypothetical protein
LLSSKEKFERVRKARHQWLMLVILATQEAKIRKITI